VLAKTGALTELIAAITKTAIDKMEPAKKMARKLLLDIGIK
jgi:hypothetical protein